MYKLTHDFRRHAGNIPELRGHSIHTLSLYTVCTDKHRGYFPVCLIKPWVNQFVAREQCNITQHCAVYKKYTLPTSAILTVRLLVLGIYQAWKLSSYGFPGYKRYIPSLGCPTPASGIYLLQRWFTCFLANCMSSCCMQSETSPLWLPLTLLHLSSSTCTPGHFWQTAILAFH